MGRPHTTNLGLKPYEIRGIPGVAALTPGEPVDRSCLLVRGGKRIKAELPWSMLFRGRPETQRLRASQEFTSSTSRHKLGLLESHFGDREMAQECMPSLASTVVGTHRGTHRQQLIRL